jgi:regulatory protein YycI of two-component signal transduction system YycFG
MARLERERRIERERGVDTAWRFWSLVMSSETLASSRSVCWSVASTSVLLNDICVDVRVNDINVPRAVSPNNTRGFRLLATKERSSTETERGVGTERVNISNKAKEIIKAWLGQRKKNKTKQSKRDKENCVKYWILVVLWKVECLKSSRMLAFVQWTLTRKLHVMFQNKNAPSKKSSEFLILHFEKCMFD